MTKEKLKTLKDIENMYIEVNATRQVSEVMKHIKVEAIKWVKEMLIKAQNDEEWIPIIREFYKFFNLTKEELK